MFYFCIFHRAPIRSWNRHLLNIAFAYDNDNSQRQAILNLLKLFENIDLQRNYRDKTFGEMLNS